MRALSGEATTSTGTSSAQALPVSEPLQPRPDAAETRPQAAIVATSRLRIARPLGRAPLARD
jgi:hypothetical protein